MQDYHILGDWGTTSARFYLYRGDSLIEQIEGPGVKFSEDIEASYEKAVMPWVAAHGPMVSVLSGMVGANIGWREVGYISCPAKFSKLSQHMVSFAAKSGDVYIVPGVRTSESLTHQLDVMRGEETQILGWAYQQKAEGGVLCLPGTHTKWVHVKDSKIDNFVSSLNGELFNILTQHSILIGGEASDNAQISNEFRHGVDIGATQTSLNQLLFSVRALQIDGVYDKAQSTSYLLGLLIGSDVESAFNNTAEKKISVIGGQGPASFYAEAIRHLGGEAEVYDGQQASVHGLRKIYEHLIDL